MSRALPRKQSVSGEFASFALKCFEVWAKSNVKSRTLQKAKSAIQSGPSMISGVVLSDRRHVKKEKQVHRCAMDYELS
jgi:hypothetical protein